jgi:hypothetical protein
VRNPFIGKLLVFSEIGGRKVETPSLENFRPFGDERRKMETPSLENFRPFGDERRKMETLHWKTSVLSGMGEGKWGTSSPDDCFVFRDEMVERWSLFIGKPSVSFGKPVEGRWRTPSVDDHRDLRILKIKD